MGSATARCMSSLDNAAIGFGAASYRVSLMCRRDLCLILTVLGRFLRLVLCTPPLCCVWVQRCAACTREGKRLNRVTTAECLSQ